MKFKNAFNALNWYFQIRLVYTIDSRNDDVIVAIVDIEKMIKTFPPKMQENFAKFALIEHSKVCRLRPFRRAVRDLFGMLYDAGYILYREAA